MYGCGGKTEMGERKAGWLGRQGRKWGRAIWSKPGRGARARAGYFVGAQWGRGKVGRHACDGRKS